MKSIYLSQNKLFRKIRTFHIFEDGHMKSWRHWDLEDPEDKDFVMFMIKYLKRKFIFKIDGVYYKASLIYFTTPSLITESSCYLRLVVL